MTLVFEFLKEQKLVILGGVFGLIYYVYHINTGNSSYYIKKMLVVVIAIVIYLVVSFLVKLLRSQKEK